MAKHKGEPVLEVRKIRFVLSDVAVRRIRAAEVLIGDLREKLHQQAPAWLTCDVAEAWLALVEAVGEIGKCCVENDPTPDAGGATDGN